MRRSLLIALLVLAGCGQASDDAASPTTPEVLKPEEGTIQLTAKQAYDKALSADGATANPLLELKRKSLGS